jgi:hypothetical protein
LKTGDTQLTLNKEDGASEGVEVQIQMERIDFIDLIANSIPHPNTY